MGAAERTHTVANDRRDRGLVIGEALGHLQVGRVQVLAAVRQEVEACKNDQSPVDLTQIQSTLTAHQQYSIYAQKPMLPQHLPRLP